MKYYIERVRKISVAGDNTSYSLEKGSYVPKSNTYRVGELTEITASIEISESQYIWLKDGDSDFTPCLKTAWLMAPVESMV